MTWIQAQNLARFLVGRTMRDVDIVLTCWERGIPVGLDLTEAKELLIEDLAYELHFREEVEVAYV